MPSDIPSVVPDFFPGPVFDSRQETDMLRYEHIPMTQTLLQKPIDDRL